MNFAPGDPNALGGIITPGGAPWRFRGDFDGESSPWQPVQLRAGIWTVTGDSWAPAVQPGESPFARRLASQNWSIFKHSEVANNMQKYKARKVAKQLRSGAWREPECTFNQTLRIWESSSWYPVSRK